MKCHEISDRIHDWVDCELSEEERQQVRSHLDTCPRCFDRSENVRRLKHLVQVKHNPGHAPRPGFRDSVSHKIAMEALAPGFRGGGWLAAAAALLIITPVIYFTWFQSAKSVHAQMHDQIADYTYDSHLRFVAGGDRWQNPLRDRVDLQRFLAQEFGRTMVIPDFADGRMRFRGVDLFELGEIKGARVYCTLAGEEFTLFVIPGVTLDHTGFCICRRLEPYTIVCRQVGDTYFSMASRMEEDRLFTDVLNEAFEAVDRGEGKIEKR